MSFEVLIVEDDDLHRQFLYDAVMESNLGDITITQACDGEEAVNLLGRNTFSSAVLDLQMPGRTGVDVARAIWGQNKQIPILFWSNFADEAYVRGIYRVAPEEANYGYLLKSSSSERLKRTLSGVFLDGQTIIDRAVGNPTNPQKSAELTAVEYEALIDIAIGLTDSAIAQYRGVSVRAVQNRLKTVYEKLGLAEVPETADGASAVNRRARAVAIALMSRKINSKILDMAESELVSRGSGHLLANNKHII